MDSRGFTLIELVLVMVIIAIGASGITSYMAYNATLYQDAVLQQSALNQGRFALERISRELRTAAPNSVRWGQNAQAECLEFVPIIRSGVYRNLPLYPSVANQLDVITVGADWNASNGQRVVVYPTTAQHIYALSQGRAVSLPAQTLNDADGNENTRRLTLPSSSSFIADSPQQRFYLLDNPVSFCRVGQQILRYSGYGFQTSQVLPPASVGVLVLQNLANSASQQAFTYTSGSFSRNASVQLVFRLNVDGSGNTLQLHHEVNIPNVP